MTATQSQIREALYAIQPEHYHYEYHGRWAVNHYETIRTILQSALDTQKPAGDAALAFDRLIDDLKNDYSNRPLGKPQDDDIRTVKAALNGDCGGGDLEEIRTLLFEKVGPEAFNEVMPVLEEALTADNAKRGE